jgi:hypothetical protein
VPNLSITIRDFFIAVPQPPLRFRSVPLLGRVFERSRRRRRRRRGHRCHRRHRRPLERGGVGVAGSARDASVHGPVRKERPCAW